MGEANLQHQVAPGNGSSIANTVDLEAPRKTVGYARHHVGDQTAGESVERTLGWLIRAALNFEGAIFASDADLSRHVAFELTLGPFHVNTAVRDVDRDVVRDGDGHPANSRHLE